MIFVPSKNRIDNAKLLKFAIETDTELTVVVEPSEVVKYKLAYAGLSFIVLKENNAGIAYARNFIKAYTEDAGIESYWQLDDDITALLHREDTKMIKDDFSILSKAEQKFKNKGIALGGLEYGQFAWCANNALVENSFCDVAVWVDNTKTFGLRYRPYLEGKEDRDFAMQVIKSGQKTARSTEYAFNAPKNGTNVGGLKETFYAAGKEKQCADRMVETWGENICQRITKPDGRPDVKIHWNRINSKQVNLF